LKEWVLGVQARGMWQSRQPVVELTGQRVTTGLGEFRAEAEEAVRGPSPGAARVTVTLKLAGSALWQERHFASLSAVDVSTFWCGSWHVTQLSWPWLSV